MSYSKIPAGKDLPNDIYVAIEIPANHAPIKYEIDKDTDCLFVDRFMATPMFYPANYGFIPNTLADDGDPLDVLVVTPYPVAPGSVIRARPVGVLHMTDEAGGDAKLIAVPHDKLSVLYKDVKEYTDLPALLLEQIKHFFENYKDLEKGKWVKVEGWGNADAARAEITKAVAAFRSKRASPKEAPQPRGFFILLADRQGRSRHPAPLSRPSPRSPTDIRSRRWSATANRARRSGQACCAGDRCGYPAAARTTLPRGARSARRDIPATTAVPGWRTGSGPGGIRVRSG